MRVKPSQTRKGRRCAAAGRLRQAVAAALLAAVALQGCFAPVYPSLDREERVMAALDAARTREAPPSPLTPSSAVSYALRNSLDAKVVELEAEYQNASRVAAKRRLLPSLTARYALNHNNHPSARWSESTKSGRQALESSYSTEQTTRIGDIGVMWSLLDFGVGYLRARQQGERELAAEQQRRRARQQIVLDVLTRYWVAAATGKVAAEAENIAAELEQQGKAVRDSVELRILSGAEGARRELSVQNGLADLEQYRRSAQQAKLELAKVMGCDGLAELAPAGLAATLDELPDFQDNSPWALQVAALERRPELYQQDTQERVAKDEARLALLQIAPNANLSLNLNNDPDKFLEWNNWMTVGARVSWDLFNIPARLAERRMAVLQGDIAKKKGLSLAAAVMAQVGIAYSDMRLARDYAEKLEQRAAARERLVEALAAGEQDGQTRPGEVLQERVRLLGEKALAYRAEAEVRIAGARLANAIGLDPDDDGNLVWRLDGIPGVKDGSTLSGRKAEIIEADLAAEQAFPSTLSGLKVVKAEDFLAEEYQAEADEEPQDSVAETRDAALRTFEAAVAAPAPEKTSPVPEEIPAGNDAPAGDQLQAMAGPGLDVTGAAYNPAEAEIAAMLASSRDSGARQDGGGRFASYPFEKPVPAQEAETEVYQGGAGLLPHALLREAAAPVPSVQDEARGRALAPLAPLSTGNVLRPPGVQVPAVKQSLKPPGK